VRRDAIAAGALLAFGAVAIHEAAQLPFGIVRNPGPGFFPWWTSVIVEGLAVILLAQVLFRPAPAGVAEPGGRLAKVAGLLAVLAAYVFFLEPLGYLFSTFLLLLFMLRVTDPQRWVVALSLSAIAAVGSYVVFAVWLSVPLPRGFFLH
jgi:putative tricarboxylic transport membrane protein